MSEPGTSDRNVDRVIRSWLHENRHEDVSRVAGAVLDQLDTTPQRRSQWWPAWRLPFMSKLVPIGFGAAAVIAVLFLGSQFIGSPSSNNGGPASQPPASVAPSEAPSAISPPPLTQRYTSEVHGISLSYPRGWEARQAFEPLSNRPGVPQFHDPGYDVLYDPVLEDHLFLWIASQPVGDSTPEDWVDGNMAECTTTEPVAVDVATGLIGGGDCGIMVAVTTDGRGYSINLAASQDDPDLVAPYDRAWFEEILATVDLRPERAVDVAPSVAP
jgi:hypothetical protein